MLSCSIRMQFAAQLLARGNTVIAGVRNPDRAQELLQLKADYSKGLDVLTLDVADTDSIASWATAISERHDTVDLLINNAGILQWSTIEDVTEEKMLTSYKVPHPSDSACELEVHGALVYVVCKKWSHCGE